MPSGLALGIDQGCVGLGFMAVGAIFLNGDVYSNNWFKGVYISISVKGPKHFLDTSPSAVSPFFYKPSAFHFNTPDTTLSLSHPPPNISLGKTKSLEVKRKFQKQHVKCKISTPFQRPTLFILFWGFFFVFQIETNLNLYLDFVI